MHRARGKVMTSTLIVPSSLPPCSARTIIIILLTTVDPAPDRVVCKNLQLEEKKVKNEASPKFKSQFSISFVYLLFLFLFIAN